MARTTRALLALNPWRTDKHPEFRGTTGGIFQEEVAGGMVIGTCRVKATGRLNFYKAVRTVMKGQPRDPLKPIGDAAIFRAAVIEQMRELELDGSKLHMFTAIGSALDWYHGWDGFFRFNGTVVAFDATINPHKDEPAKAHVLVRGEDALEGFRDVSWHIAQCFGLPARRLEAMKGVIKL